MTADLTDWQDEHLLDHRRRLRTAMFVSLAIHGVLLALFAISPPVPMAPMPEYLAVDLVAAPPAGAAVPRPSAPPKTSPAPNQPPPPAPEAPAPEPPPPPPAPTAKAPVQVLPEESPGKIREAKPEPPKVVAKVQPKPEPKPTPRRRKREEALSYDDAMAELGLDETSEALVPAEKPGEESADSEAAPQAQAGIQVPPEELAWGRAVSRLIKKRFPNFSRFEGRGLVAQVEVEVSSSGALSREPRLIATSGNLDFDRMILAVVERAAPLPPPPRAGAMRLNLKSDQ